MRVPRMPISLLLLVFVCWNAPAQVAIENARFDVLSSKAAGSVVITHTTLDLGKIENVFDGNVSSLARTPNINPAFVQLAYTTPRTVRRFRVHLSYGTSYQWSIEKADSQADMDSKTGSWQTIIPTRSMTQGTWSEATLAQPVTARIFKLNVRRFGGDNYCHINEWEIYGDVVVNQIDITPADNIVLYSGESRPFSAIGRNTTVNETYNINTAVTWNVTGVGGEISTNGVFTATAVGTAGLFASIGTVRSPTVNITVQQANLLPDIDVLYIERTPRLSFDPANTAYTTGLPAPGQRVTYQAHVKNWGTAEAVVSYQWFFDGQFTSNGVVVVPPGQKVKVPFAWTWETNDHHLEFIADPQDQLPETSELNNRRKIRTNALLVGLWVEQSLYNYMHHNQLKLNDGANSFEDWGQRMIDRWNWLHERAIFPVSPNGFLDRLALDQVVVVPDNALPLAGGLSGNNPDSRDRTVDMQWGYPWNPDSVAPGEFYGFRWNGPFYLDFGSIHEMNHARYHVDLYGLDENHNSSSQNVLLYDDSNQLVPGSSLMPFIAWDVVYYNKWRDIMGAGPPVFDAYSAGAWNWKHHRRGQGNQNAPPDIGRFLNDLPTNNVFLFIDQTGTPIIGATVEYYRAEGGFYTKRFNNSPEDSFVTDSEGKITLPRNPFGGTLPLGGFGPASPIIIFKLRHNSEQYYFFQEVTDFNIQYWLGNTQTAHYIRQIDLRDKPVTVPAGAFLGNYFSDPIHTRPDLTRTDSAIDFTWPGEPAPGIIPDQFTVYWHGRIQFTEGWKEFSITADGGIQLAIDGRVVFDQQTNTTLQTWKPVLYTTSNSPFVNPGQSTPNGNYHRVEIRYWHNTGPARVALSWADVAPVEPIPANAWRADYYTTRTLTGYALTRYETAINFNYGNGSPDPAIGSDTFSARWTGDWDLGPGTYEFRAVTDDGMRVWLDDVLVLNQWRDQPPATYTFQRTFDSRARHRLRIEYYEGAVTAQATFGWTAAPFIISHPQSVTALPGQSLSFSVSANAVPAPTYQWYFGKSPLPGETNATLTIASAQLSNTGSYTVVVSNSVSALTSKEAVLTIVSNPPQFSAVTLNPGGTIEFELTAPAPQVYELQASTDLRTWIALERATNTTGTVRFQQPTGPEPHRFFRAQLQ